MLNVSGLSVHFPIYQGLILKRRIAEIKAVEDVSFTIGKGMTLGLVGESGCGKTTVGRAVLHLEKPTTGQVLFDGMDLSGLDQRKMRNL
jgi:ABC-type oligopeptide transport system ATPase subunit